MSAGPVCLGLPVYESVPAESYAAHMRLVAHSAAAGIDLRIWHTAGALIDVARTALAQWSVDEGASHLFMLDADVIPPPDALVRLLAHDVTVVSGLYHARSYGYGPIVAYRDDSGKLVWPDELRSPGLHRVDGIGGGCLLINTAVFSALGLVPGEVPDAESWPFVLRSNEQIGEDGYFSNRCADAGIPIHFDPAVSCGHLTAVVIDASNADTSRAAVREALAALNP